ncbi:hypothetical protein AXG93_2930s1040 [Marchantia polymorpha subsp. ruderalis]|uniref:Uncharacterized protein n=1 Tax=Marchantia polymorpha subsp. ruderalis TaxID=1480154 RepID=A0A176VS13_MARPO|nr:hypothetical protein AXG93_2930s1040 [Marchantia polymorpha subsp. ruderalis]
MSKARGGNEAGVVEQERAWPIKADEEESCEGRGGKEREDDAQCRGARELAVVPVSLPRPEFRRLRGSGGKHFTRSSSVARHRDRVVVCGFGLVPDDCDCDCDGDEGRLARTPSGISKRCSSRVARFDIPAEERWTANGRCPEGLNGATVYSFPPLSLTDPL